MYLTFMLGIAIFIEHSRRKILPKQNVNYILQAMSQQMKVSLGKMFLFSLEHEWNCRHFFFPTMLSLSCKTRFWIWSGIEGSSFRLGNK